MNESVTDKIVRGERWAAARTLDDLGDGMFRRVRQQLDLTAFGMNVKVMQPGSSSKTHWHTEQEEIIFVHDGEITVVLGDDSLTELGPGAIVKIGPMQPHQVFVTSDQPAIIVMMGGKDGVVEGDAEFAQA